MKQIRAFVGHSFSKMDQTLIREFTDYFDSLEKTVSFAWDHAEEAEPREELHPGKLFHRLRHLDEGPAQ
ncbi:MAG: hypothetical protein NTV04_24195, partial [Deltaproteobacteria bacterium]|nr:hypothetical protein [Deltaproteobacteria bacterium]